jgi:hypothetical protein
MPDKFSIRMLSYHQSHRDTREELVEVIASSSSRRGLGFYRFEELLTLDRSVSTERTIIGDGRDDTYVLLVSAISDEGGTSAWTPTEAAYHLQNMMSQGSTSSKTCLYSLYKDDGGVSIPFIASLFSMRSKDASSVIFSVAELDALKAISDASGSRPRPRQRLIASYKARHVMIIIICLISAVATVIVVGFWDRRAADNMQAISTYLRYDTIGSEGPRYQLQFSYANVTAWKKSHPYSHGEWFLRIDDQAMIPATLVDEEELRYQQWYQTRYPEMNAIRLNQTYLDENFLGDPEAIQVPADKTFHMSHCVRAVRRYWQAKETGRHVCPRDIDYRHIKHCLDALDMWAFPEGARGSVGEMHMQPARTDDTTRLVWKTKVCFD